RPRLPGAGLRLHPRRRAGPRPRPRVPGIPLCLPVRPRGGPRRRRAPRPGGRGHAPARPPGAPRVTRRPAAAAADLGRTAADSPGVLDLLAEGAVRAAALMRGTPFAEGAAAEVRGRPGVGVHGTLVSAGDVPAWRPITSVASLVDDAGYLRT